MPYLPVPDPSKDSNGLIGVAPILEHYALFGAFSLHTKINPVNSKRSRYPITQPPYVWPTAAHALEAQKLLRLLKLFEQTHEATRAYFLKYVLHKLQTLPDVAESLHSLLQDNLHTLGFQSVDAFHRSFDLTSMEDFLTEVMELKFAQHPELKAAAIQFAKRGIMPVDLTTDSIAFNNLGLTILELGNQYLQQMGDTPAIADPAGAYQALRREHPSFCQKSALSRYTLEKHLITQMKLKGLLDDNHLIANPTATERALEMIHRLFPGAKKILVHHDPIMASNLVLRVYFDDLASAQAFAEFAESPHCICPDVTLGQLRATRVFTLLAEPDFDLEKPEDRFNAITRELAPTPNPVNDNDEQTAHSYHIEVSRKKIKTWGDLPPAAKFFLTLLIIATFPIALPIALAVNYTQQRAKQKALENPLLTHPLSDDWQQPTKTRFQASHNPAVAYTPPTASLHTSLRKPVI